ncbi:hypothetical protein GQ53DRAFT_848135 [Thozetella sp. PMI_491]|nr:hypothetical protein GQ53DRAFT_848135 [Thozetella sp. PMI_491]
MKNTAFLLLASAVAVSAQLTLENNTYTCGKPNVAYCAGDSLKTDIIVRCDNKGHGQPGRCGDNLAGQPPVGNTPSLCVQSDEIVGDAACEKNCVVYAASAWTLPTDECTPTFTASSTASASGSTSYSHPIGSLTSTSAPEGTTTDIITTPSDTVIISTPIGTISSRPVGNGSVVTITSAVGATRTPSGPASSTTAPPNGAPLNQAGMGLAALGVLAAYLI